MKIINDESTVKTINVDGRTWTLQPFTGVALTLTTADVFDVEKGVGGDARGGLSRPTISAPLRGKG